MGKPKEHILNTKLGTEVFLSIAWLTKKEEYQKGVHGYAIHEKTKIPFNKIYEILNELKKEKVIKVRKGIRGAKQKVFYYSINPQGLVELFNKNLKKDILTDGEKHILKTVIEKFLNVYIAAIEGRIDNNIINQFIGMKGAFLSYLFTFFYFLANKNPKTQSAQYSSTYEQEVLNIMKLLHTTRGLSRKLQNLPYNDTLLGYFKVAEITAKFACKSISKKIKKKLKRA